MRALAAAVLLAVATAAEGAQATTTPAPDAVTARAKAHFKHGGDLYRQARYREAIAEFEEAYRLRPHGVIFYNLAQCHERLGDLAAALRAYHEYVRAVPRADDVASVNAAMANLEARLGASGVQQLLVYTEPADAEVYVDGLARGRTPFAAVLPHGAHQLRLVKPGYVTVAREALLTSDRSLEIDVALKVVSTGAATPSATTSSASAPTEPSHSRHQALSKPKQRATSTAPSTSLATSTSPSPSPSTSTSTSTSPSPSTSTSTSTSPSPSTSSSTSPSPSPSPSPSSPSPSPSTLAASAAQRTPAPELSIPLSAPEVRPAARRSRVWTWVAAGAAAAALTAGGAYGLSAHSASADLRASVHDTATAQRLADTATSRARTANLLYAVGAAAGAAGVGLFFFEGTF